MAEELYVPAVAPPPVRQIKYFQLFSVVMAVHPASVPAWQLRGAFAFLGFACGGPEAISRADGSCAAFSSDVVYISGGQVKNLVLRGDSGEVLSVRLRCVMDLLRRRLLRHIQGFGVPWRGGRRACLYSSGMESPVFKKMETSSMECSVASIRKEMPRRTWFLRPEAGEKTGAKDAEQELVASSIWGAA
ncbi:hypothetical protein PVAP13_9KG471400 [Panicum virgatum]|uniref:Uncharacterized protein n=1 Tax=Panicum virgatum TaxID=38727 RepID=A0A8T0NTE0_PANVG|nr:hypothetical protein PVAP13_9KG471400 [Panicum virgatum]